MAENAAMAASSQKGQESRPVEEEGVLVPTTEKDENLQPASGDSVGKESPTSGKGNESQPVEGKEFQPVTTCGRKGRGVTEKKFLSPSR